MTELRQRARTIACVLALVAPVQLAAGQGRRPPEPDTASVAVGTSSATPTLRPSAAARAPYFVSDGRFIVMLAGAPTASAMDSASTRAISTSCSTHGAASDLPSGARSESVALDGQKLVVIVNGAERGTDPCQIEWNVSPLSIWRAATVPANDGTIARSPLAMQLIIDGVLVGPSAAYRRPAYHRVDGGWRRAGTQLRYYYDMSVVRPREDGHPHQMAIEIWDRDPTPTTVDIDGAAADRLAMEQVGWKLATLQPSDVAPGIALTTSRFMVPAMARIVDTARLDLVSAGIRAATWAASSGDSTSASGVVARLVTAEALLARGEPALARGVVAGVQRTHPCLVPPAGSSSALAQLVASTRPLLARCDPVTPAHAAALSIVPGLGNLAVGDRRSAAIGAGLVAVALTRAIMVNAQANSRHAEYLATRNSAEASVIYNRVSDLQGQRNIALGAAAGFWIVDALLAARGARVHAEHVENDRF